jgi:DNA-binding MarR family transcriptional regulator
MPRSVKQTVGDWPQSDKPEQVVGFLLKSLHHTLRQSMDEALRARGLEMSFAHFATLFGLFSAPGITGAQLARRAMVSAQTMNAILRRLETEGLIERGPHPESRRADSWSLTEAGEKQLARARVIGDTVFSRMLAALTTDEVADLQSYLRRCIAALETGAPRDAATVPSTPLRARARRPRQRVVRPTRQSA